jgi:hypothetical protein
MITNEIEEEKYGKVAKKREPY